MAILSFESMRGGVDFENLVDEFASFKSRAHIFPFVSGSNIAWQGAVSTSSFAVMVSFRNHSKIMAGNEEQQTRDRMLKS